MILNHNTERRIMVGGRDLTIRAFCAGTVLSQHSFKQAKWTVKLTCEDRSESFRYFAGSGIADFDTSINICDFLICIESDAYVVLEHYVDFLAEYGYSEANGRKVWNACQRNADKLCRLFGCDYAKFFQYIYKKEYDESRA